MNKHKWHKEIKAWADGAEIEFFHRIHQKWVDAAEPPIWELDVQYRIKPQPKKPQYLYVYADEGGLTLSQHKSVFMNGVPYIGKIKLEQDDD